MHSFSLLTTILLLACTTPKPHVLGPDGGAPGDDALGVDATLGDGHTTVDASAGDGSGPAACVVTGDGGLFAQCCPFTPSCASGTACYWTFANDPVPQQDTAACMAIGATAIGQTCQTSNDACVAGAWC